MKLPFHLSSTYEKEGVIQNVPKRHEYHSRKADPEVFRAYMAMEESHQLLRHNVTPRIRRHLEIDCPLSPFFIFPHALR